MAASHTPVAKWVALLLLACATFAYAEDCVITTTQEGDSTIIVKDCPTFVVEITCSLNFPMPICTNRTLTKTATTTSSTATQTSVTATSTLTSTASSLTRTQTSTSVTATSSATSTTSSATVTLSTTSSGTSTTIQTKTATSVTLTTTTTLLEDTNLTVGPGTVMIMGTLAFPRQNVTQEDAETAVVSTLSEYLGLPQSNISATAKAYAHARRLQEGSFRQSPPRRLSDVWGVEFAIVVPEVDELRVRQLLEDLASNATSYTTSLREELTALGSMPIEDFSVTVTLEGEEFAPFSDDLPIVFIIVAVAAIGILAGLMIWKTCGSSQTPTEEHRRFKTELQEAAEVGAGYEQEEDEVLPRLSTVTEAPSTVPATSNDLASPISSLEVMTGSIGDLPMAGGPSLDSTSVATPVQELPEKPEVEPEVDPPMPPPPEQPPAASSPSLQDAVDGATVQLSDVHPEVLMMPPRQRTPASDWILMDADLSHRTCQSLSPSSWSGSWTWTQLSQFHRRFVPPTSKEYSLTFQRGGRLVGQGSDALSNYKLTAGGYRKNGELVWREVPQTPSGLAFECSGHLRARRRKEPRADEGDSFEIVGVFTAFDTSISAQQLGSGRFTIHTWTGIQPTAIGNPAAYFAADRV